MPNIPFADRAEIMLLLAEPAVYRVPSSLRSYVKEGNVCWIIDYRSQQYDVLIRLIKKPVKVLLTSWSTLNETI